MNRLSSQDGAALIEFALAMPLFLLILACLTDYAFYIQQEMELSEAAAAGAAFGAIPGEQKNTAGMQQAAMQAAPDVSGLTVTANYFYTCPSVGNACTSGLDSNPAMYVQVTTTADIPALLRWPGMPADLSLSGKATYRVPWTQ